MPLLDMGRTNFKLIFSPDERNLEYRTKSLLYRISKEKDIIHDEKKTPKNGLPYYTLNANLVNAFYMKEIFKEYNLQYSDKYKLFVSNLYKAEKYFIALRDKVVAIKALNSELIGEEIDGKYVIDGYVFKTTPWDHQKAGFKLLKDAGSFILEWDMRTGKTFTIANDMQRILLENPDCMTLVIAPSNIVESTWIADIYKHTDMEGYAASQKLNSQRLKGLRRGNITMPIEGGLYREFKGSANYVVLNHDAISNEKVMQYILEELKPDNFIVDEFHCFKNPTSNRTKAAVKISKYIHGKNGQVILMSGTPIPKDIRDIYAPCQIVDPDMLPITFTEFKRRFCNIQGGYANGDPGGIEKYLGEKNQDELKMRTCARSQRVLIQDVHDMPKKIETIKYVKMSEEQFKHHSMLKSVLYTELPKDSSILSVTAMTKLLKMVQITGGYIYDQDRSAQKLKKNPKLEELDNMLQQILSNDKNNVVLFTNFRTPVKMLREYLQKSDWEFCELTTQSDTARSKAVWDFQNDKSKRVMLAQPALCPGNDFSKANYAIFYDNNYKYVDRDQAETRIFTHTSIEHGTVVVIDLICQDSVDEFIYNILQKKKNKNAEFTKEEVWDFLKK